MQILILIRAGPRGLPDESQKSALRQERKGGMTGVCHVERSEEREGRHVGCVKCGKELCAVEPCHIARCYVKGKCGRRVFRGRCFVVGGGGGGGERREER